MLLELRIANLALIDKAEIQFGPGLNVLTGETGAGKSILIHALGLLAGDKATADQVGKSEGGAERARVEGSFDLSHAPHATEFLKAQGFETAGELVVMREVNGEGRSRIRINGQMAGLATLRELGDLLIDLHGQHQHQRLLRPESHISYLDEFGAGTHHELKAAVRTAWNAWHQSQQKLAEITAGEQQRAQRIDMLRYQADEIDAVAPAADEDETLSDARARLMNAEKLRAAAVLCHDALAGDGEVGTTTLLARALKAGQEIESYDSSVGEWVQALQSALYEIEDAALQARSYLDDLEADPLQLDQIESRLHQLGRLKRKYGETIAAVLLHRAAIDEELANLDQNEQEMNGLVDRVQKQRQAYLDAAAQLSSARRALAARLATEVIGHLRTLAMERAQFEVGFEELAEGTAAGTDRVEFLFSANPGRQMRPLARIASGGEISRVMLALRSAMFAPQQDTPAAGVVPILVFDEIDVGIGGVTAESVGAKMRELARGFQVFCVTHLPQIARRADSQFCVLKASDERQTRVTVDALQGTARVHELARMLGGVSPTTLAHATQMLEPDFPVPL